MHRKSRKRICSWIAKHDSITMETKVIAVAVNDHNGDAIDSLIAAFATFNTLREGAIAEKTDNELYAIEGHVYI